MASRQELNGSTLRAVRYAPSWRAIGTLWARLRTGPLRARKTQVALAGYLVVSIFGIAYFVARRAATGEPRQTALAVAGAVVLPLVIALIGDRIRSIKTPLIEVSLETTTVPISTNVPADELNAITASGGFDLSEQLRRLIAAPGSQLLEVDLRDGNYWWPTRLFLLSALLNDYTDVQRLIFVQGPDRSYVGMATPAAVCSRLELVIPGLSAAYAAARESAISAAIHGELNPRPLGQSRPAPVAHPLPTPRPDTAQTVVWTTWQWPTAVRQFAGLDEVEHPDRVGRGWLVHSLGDGLRWAAIVTDGSPPDSLMQYRIVTMPEDYVALVAEHRLISVVGRCRLASRIATASLAQQLSTR